jgi:hypothetical protein
VPDSAQACYLGAQLAYQRVIFKEDPLGGGRQMTDDGFSVAAQ